MPAAALIGVVDDDGVETRRVERPLFAETADVLVGVLVGSVVASPRRADAHRRRARLGDGHDGELHAEGVGPGGGDRQTALGVGGAVDAGDEVVDAERWDRRLVVGVGMDDEGTGDDDRFAAAFDDVARRRSDQRAVDVVLARGSTGRSGRRRVRGRSGERRRRRRCRPRRGCVGRRGRCRVRARLRRGCGAARSRRSRR